jgi:hypothetical protein
MKAYISTFPALGQVTHIDRNASIFTALLEIDPSRASEPWQISLWHSADSQWQEVPMDPVQDSMSYPTALQPTMMIDGNPLTRLYFTTPLVIHLPISFTIKFRGNPTQAWKWVKDHQGTLDGTIILKSVTRQDTISSELRDHIEGLDPAFRVKNYPSQSPGTTLWVVEAPIEAADGAKSNIKEVKFGLPWGQGKFSR